MLNVRPMGVVTNQESASSRPAGDRRLATPYESPSVAYTTNLGLMILGTAEKALTSQIAEPYCGQVQLLLTSPPFPLNHKKRYGNQKGEAYQEWFRLMAPLFRRFLAPSGSVVIELGNAWEPGRPAMSTLALESLLSFLKEGQFTLCQTFVAYNRARLPTPAQWVNVERIRVKDSYTNIWWMAVSDRPKADNRRVLVPYSASMKRLLSSKRYNSGRRPSEHSIGETSFLSDNGGAIPSNVLTYANTSASDRYQNYCRRYGYQPHPARMPTAIAEFFIRFLSEPGDLVLDPFAGSNTTGAAAEALGRRWLAIEPRREYVLGSRGRFPSLADSVETDECLDPVLRPGD